MSDHADTTRELAARAIDLRPEGWERAQAVKALAARCDALERDYERLRKNADRLNRNGEEAMRLVKQRTAERDALENALREIEAEEGYGESPAPIIVRAVKEIARAALAATNTTREGEVCACLDETGERKVRLYERCERCGTFMAAGERQET